MNQLQMSDELLMEAVASQCALFIAQKALKKNIGEILIVCGPGNNGGDGYVIARHLHSMKMRCRVFTGFGLSSEMLKKQRVRLEKLQIQVESLNDFLTLMDSSKERIIIDALFGVGLHRKIEEPFLSVVGKINELSAFRISIDTPSGLDVDKGVNFGDCVNADLTLAIGALKPGFFTAEGPTRTGRIKVICGGFSEDLLPDTIEKYFVRLPGEIKSWIPKRSKRSHKGSVGKCHLVAGSSKYLGAGKLVAMGALASGASFVQAYGPSDLRAILKDLPELIFRSSYQDLLIELRPDDSVVIGPGVSDSQELGDLLKELMKRNHSNVVLDAGAFRAMKEEGLQSLPNWIWTPHPGEMAELLELEVSEVEADRFAAVARAGVLYGGQFLLKGFQPILRTSKKEWWCLPYGDDRLAKAGTGDILAGLLGGLMAQMGDSAKATALAVYIHAHAAKLITFGRGGRSLLASELPLAIGRVLC